MTEHPPTSCVAPAPPKRKPTGLWLVLAVVALLGCVVLGTGVFLVVRTVSDATGPVRAVAREYLDAIEAADYPHAHELLCSSVRGQITVETLAADEPKIDQYEIVNSAVEKENGATGGSVLAKITTQGVTSTKMLILVIESGAWRVCGT